ncbi:MAG TPA: TetR/AcrR family transcriptional regulator [Solirubrobacteraceae bacterium]
MASPARSPGRTRNPRGQGERLREALLEAAIELLAEAGDVDALSVRAVTAHVGVTPTALYLHFADRDELLEAVKDSCFEELRRYVLAAEERAAGDPRRQAEQMCLAYLQFATDLPGHYRVLFHTRRGSAPADEVPRPSGPAELNWPESGAQAFGDLVRGIERCLASGLDPFQSALMVWAGMHGYVLLRESLGHFPFPGSTGYINQLLDAHLTPHGATA